ncbi:receptor-interacting serine/threonine-protein kinase 1 [Acanthochromis polyacanthus]|uniref:Receptor (TNFRSF)-interacting serine-threonine kinase 1, like n=1 Tax=Acanthochromis polyacanthus TaxID=80966 RepID=A0A3Q1GT53_9TELE|nr:receptor-interacting serine/threonine-protein kinase 1 [Acanthochromis polyacanthus]XP_022062806.1 receptor-interacting serine/threonine-protein kinase 1 [Acanthochromis polyacanthus]
MATAPMSSLHMRSTDLIIKEPLDYGGFGEVYLCYHVTLGQVVLKTMYTGPLRNEENKRSLLEEGNIMASLNHERVVKLLGVIMEDRDYSLVMELIPRGNLLVMLETVDVPVSIKGRIILEILEGMVYLTEKRVLHKDVKPENILVDKDFHIKIADLGLATFQTWSKLTKEESRRKSGRGRSAGVRGAGTLSYMAPEHLESIHTPSTEKSDVYSFAIVVWVILTREEPYANARNEDQISQCVRKGDRPAEDLIPEDTPAEMIELMKRCWHHSPEQRPTFEEAYNTFYPFYMETLEQHVEEDLHNLRMDYEGPEELIEKMKSLSMSHECFPPSEHDSPAPLVSSDRSVSEPVEASIEDLHDIPYEPSVESIQTDARATNAPSALEEKLDRELNYHKHGSYNCEHQPYEANSFNNYSNPSLQNHMSTSDHALRQPEQDRSSVHSWTKGGPVQPTSQEEALHRPTTAGLYDSMNSSTPTPSNSSMYASTLSLPPLNQQHPHSHYDRQQSWPAYPVLDTSAPDATIGRLLNPSKCASPQNQGSLCIHNASGIQIGSNNTLSIRGYDPSLSCSSLFTTGPAVSPIKEGILKYDDYAVTEQHLDLLRDNIGSQWKRCARRLGLSEVEIQTIEFDYVRDGLPEMVHQMLERWKMKEGSFGCTIGKLCRALEGNIKVDIIQKILDICSSSSLEMS